MSTERSPFSTSGLRALSNLLTPYLQLKVQATTFPVVHYKGAATWTLLILLARMLECDSAHTLQFGIEKNSQICIL